MPVDAEHQCDAYGCCYKRLGILYECPCNTFDKVQIREKDAEGKKNYYVTSVLAWKPVQVKKGNMHKYDV